MGRRLLNSERAARLAKVLGRSQQQLARLALQELVDQASLKMKVDVAAASDPLPEAPLPLACL